MQKSINFVLSLVRRYWKPLLFGSIVALLAVEALLARLMTRPDWAAQRPGPLLESARMMYRMNTPILQYLHGQHDPALGYRMQAGTCTFKSAEFEVPYRFNSAGLRDDEQSLAAPEIIFLGDSITLGWGVEEKNTFAHIVERETGMRGLNAAVSSYGTARQMMLLQQLDTSALRYLILQHHANDGQENLAFSQNTNALPVMSPETFARLAAHEQKKARGMCFRHIRALARKWLEKKRNRPGMAIPPQDEVQPFLHALAFGNNKIPAGTKLILLDLDERNITSPAFTVLLKDEITRSDYPLWIREAIFIDTFSSPGPDDCYNLDGHPDARGHAILAEKILSALHNNSPTNILPDDHYP